jgi:hypothetical protein
MAIDQFAATLGKWFGADMTGPVVTAKACLNLASSPVRGRRRIWGSWGSV